MPEIKQPTCGRMVHYYTNGSASTIKQSKCPAVVLNDDSYPDLFVMHEDGGGIRKSIPHKSIAAEGTHCWDWPEIKP